MGDDREQHGGRRLGTDVHALRTAAADPTDDGEVEKAPAYEVHFRDLVNRLTSEIFEKMFGVCLGDVRRLLPESDKDFAEDYIQSAFSELWVNDPVVKKGIGIGGLLRYRALARFR